jgi:tetratricopeptide (TPR) repeat protein
MQRLLSSANEITNNIENGRYKTDQEVRDAAGVAFGTTSPTAQKDAPVAPRSSPSSGSDSINASSATTLAPETASTGKLREAAAKFSVGQYQEAFNLYSEAIASDPKNPKAYLGRGWAYFCTVQNQAALKDLDEAIRLNPTDGEGYFRRGLVLASGSQRRNAIDSFTNAIERSPKYAEAYFERGVLRYEEKQLDKAREDFDKAIGPPTSGEVAFCPT